MPRSIQKLSLLYLLCIIQIIVSPSKSSPHPNGDSNLVKKSRVKRNLGQLISLLYNDSPYKPIKLANYGNWCGKGGDLMGDGSYVDGCDLCCKFHDNCYNKTRHTFEGCTPLFTMYNYRHGEENPEIENENELTSSEEREEIHKRKFPTCLDNENEAPSCKQGVCQCDVDFIMCLKKQPCDPHTVEKRGGYWWIPW